MARLRMTAKMRIKDKGWKKLNANVKELARGYLVKMGLPEDVNAPKESRRGIIPGVSLVDVATRHEFGDDSMPERSFIRTAMRDARPGFQSLVNRLTKQFLFGKIENALGIVGQFGQTAIQKKIQDGDSKWPALSDQTIARKGSSKILIDTGQLVQSIRYKVERKK